MTFKKYLNENTFYHKGQVVTLTKRPMDKKGFEKPEDWVEIYNPKTGSLKIVKRSELTKDNG